MLYRGHAAATRSALFQTRGTAASFANAAGTRIMQEVMVRRLTAGESGSLRLTQQAGQHGNTGAKQLADQPLLEGEVFVLHFEVLVGLVLEPEIVVGHQPLARFAAEILRPFVPRELRIVERGE